jgi:hypothetical protein
MVFSFGIGNGKDCDSSHHARALREELWNTALIWDADPGECGSKIIFYVDFLKNGRIFRTFPVEIDQQCSAIRGKIRAASPL